MGGCSLRLACGLCQLCVCSRRGVAETFGLSFDRSEHTPILGGRLDEPLGLAVGAWGIGSGEAMLQSQVATGLGALSGSAGGSVIGEHGLGANF
jgi:hypothetical protein